jgi:hypothetical protein
MLKLSDVSLLCASNVEIDKCIAVLKYVTSKIDFGEVMFITSTEGAIKAPSSMITMDFADDWESELDYSKFIIHEAWKFSALRYMMIIQADGFPVNINAWSDEFLAYDYIGAPWGLHPEYYKYPYPPVTEDNRVGNGGFSLRSVPFMSKVSDLAH